VVKRAVPTCLSVDELASYAVGTGTPAHAEHVDRCDACRRGVAAAVRAARDATANLRKPSSDAATEAAPGPASVATLPIRNPARYVVGNEVARGGMGRIVWAQDLELGRRIAIKELLSAHGGYEKRFEREVRITARLQHPAIIAVQEAGRWPSGEPFFIMKLVNGQSLDKAIAGRATLEARLALVANVIAVVDALAYAHSMRVIHRDLKPANVLVGEFGETVVIDWGLAKDLSDPSGAPDLAVGPYRSSAVGETQEGSVMGTPAYMPAEQANGEAVDERADVYALGAMLYHVLAGAPPYTAKTSEMILVQVVGGPPQRLDERVAGVPPDLVTIVHKAMAYDAADRYPTAKELADDLKKFQTGQLVGAHRYSAGQLVRRWIRRHRTAVGVAAIATIVLGVLGVLGLQQIFDEQARTERQQQIAERSRDDAERLINFMLVDLRDRLAPRAQIEVLDEAVKQAVAYYDRKGPATTDKDRSNRAVLRTNFGDVLRAQGDSAGALREYRAALAVFQVLAPARQNDVELLRSIVIVHENIGHIVLAQGDVAGALAEYRAAAKVAAQSVAADPENANAKEMLAAAHGSIGAVLLERGDTAGALAEFRAALPLAEAVAARDPQNTDFMSLLVFSHINIGDALIASGDRAKGRAEYRAALAVATTLVKTDPDISESQRQLAIAHDKNGDALLADGDAAGALTERRAAKAIFEALVKKDPAHAEHRHDLATSNQAIGDILLDQGDATGALAEYQAATTLNAVLASQDPTNLEKQHALAGNHESAGDALRAKGDRARALAAYRAALAIDERVAAKIPNDEQAASMKELRAKIDELD
jgi:tetratricopeptide (TPR) repeat protein